MKLKKCKKKKKIINKIDLYKINPISKIIKNKIIHKLYINKDNINVLDLFSCSGNFGFFFLSKKTINIDFVEKSEKYTKIIKKKIIKNDENNIKVYNEDVFKFIKKIINKKYNIIIMDPPYEISIYKNFYNHLLNIMQKNAILLYRKKKNNHINKEINIFFKLIEKIKFKKYEFLLFKLK